MLDLAERMGYLALPEDQQRLDMSVPGQCISLVARSQYMDATLSFPDRFCDCEFYQEGVLLDPVRRHDIDTY